MFVRLIRLAAAAAVLCTSAFAVAEAAPASVGYQHLEMPDPAGGVVEIGVWYPAEAAPHPVQVGLLTADLATDAPVAGAGHPLIVMSHGNGGQFGGHLDTAIALVRAGFVAAALTHTGDNYRDHSKAIDLPNRPRQLKLLVDYMLTAWPGRDHLDAGRIGAFGFSAGGFTVLALAGGEPDLSTIAPHCASHPQVFDCALIRQFPSAMTAIARARLNWTHDTRIRAVVAAAPAEGFAFGQAGLAQVTQPVQLWRAEADEILPHPDYAEAVRIALPAAPDYHVVANAGHYDFLAPCSEAMARVAPFICPSRPGFDRAAFHEAFNRDVVAFFQRTLGR